MPTAELVVKRALELVPPLRRQLTEEERAPLTVVPITGDSRVSRACAVVSTGRQHVFLICYTPISR